MHLPYLFTINNREILPFFKSLIHKIIFKEKKKRVYKLPEQKFTTVEPDEQLEFNEWANRMARLHNDILKHKN